MTLTINKEKLKHLTTLAGVVALPLLTVWQDVTSQLAEKIALSFGVVASLCFDPATKGQIANYLLGGVGILTPVITIIVGHMSHTAQGGAIVSTVLAVLANLNKIFKAQATITPPAEMAKELVDKLKKA